MRGLTVVLVAAFAVPVPAAMAVPVQGQCANPSGTYAGAVPWGQRLVDPARVWPLTRGAGQLVAVIGTGVDGQNSQFAPGQLVGGPGTAADDCDGRGSIAAGIVGAQQDPATTFAGVAPGAKILPIRYTQASGDGKAGGDPGALAEAIDRAVDRDAGVILIAVPAASDSPALTSAVNRAHERGAVVVSPAAATQEGSRTYPTATSGVLGVGSTNPAGEPAQTESGDYIGISAPGAELVSTSAGAGGTVAHRWPVTDAGLAAAYVAGAAALVRAYHPDLTADQVVTRLTLTASRPSTGAHDPRRGWGMLDAYAAVSAAIPANAPGPGSVPPPKPAHGAAIVPAAPAVRPATDRFSGGLALIGVALAGAAGITVAAVRRGRRRKWRPSRFTP